MAFTDRYNLQRLTTSDFSENSYKFSDADRVLIDTLLYLGAEGHHHNGGAATEGAPDTAPAVSLDTTTGTIPSGTRVYYKFTYVDGTGVETSASPEVYIDTPPGVVPPGAPTLSYTTTGGSLQPGSYFYVLTAYDEFNSRETLIGTAAFLSVPFTTSTNKITITMPTLPGGATGFNIYRKGPSATGYRYLVSTTSSSYVDTGAVEETQTRSTPTANTTTSSNSVEITLPGATPALPGVGYFWRIYRTFIEDDWTNSRLVTTDEVSYVDTGAATSVGEPPTAGTAVGSPSKILLTNAAEVQGLLPTANIEDFDTAVSALAQPAGVQILGGTDPTQIILTNDSGQSVPLLSLVDEATADRIVALIQGGAATLRNYGNSVGDIFTENHSDADSASIGVFHDPDGSYVNITADGTNGAYISITAKSGQGSALGVADNLGNSVFDVYPDGTIESATITELTEQKLSRLGGVQHGYTHAGTAATPQTISLVAANVYSITLAANLAITMPTVTAAPGTATPASWAHEFELWLIQDATGSRTVTWDASVVWPGGVAPTLTTTAGKRDLFKFRTLDTGTTWYGQVVAQNY